MTWCRRWPGRTPPSREAARNSWRTAWASAVEVPDRARIDTLTAELDALALPEEEIELEREMLEGLHAAYEQRAQLETGALPVLETSHRVIGGEKCHFS